MKFKKGNRWKSSRSELRYKTWRKSVFSLNKGKYGFNKYYVCVKCGKKRKTTRVLHAHHIFSWDKFSKQRYDRRNGVVLCKYCHNNFHYKHSFEALDNPSLLLNWLSKSGKRKTQDGLSLSKTNRVITTIKEYINEKSTN